MNSVPARASLCLAIFIVLFVGFFAVATHDRRTLAVFNHGDSR